MDELAFDPVHVEIVGSALFVLCGLIFIAAEFVSGYLLRRRRRKAARHAIARGLLTVNEARELAALRVRDEPPAARRTPS